jgi:hypothetical protein
LIEAHETTVRANERLSNFSFEELCAIRADLIRRLYLNPARLLRIVYKLWRGHELFRLAQLLRSNIVRVFTNPYGVGAPARIAVDETDGTGQQPPSEPPPEDARLQSDAR